jgi:hypothetical protein
MQEQVRRPRPHAAGVPSIHAPVACAEPVAHLLNLRCGDHVRDEASKPLTSNRAVENAAITFVLAYEQAHGREATDTRGGHAPADVESDDRVIEVKAFGLSARGNDLWLESRQVDEARTNGRFHLYVVDNVRQGNPTAFRLIDLHGDVLTRFLERARPQSYVTLPFPVGEYDAAVAGEQ